MPTVRSRPGCRGSSAADLKRLLHLPELRNAALRAIRDDLSHVLYPPEIHKALLNHLYATYMASGLPDPLIGEEFWRVYRHLVEGDPLDTIPVRLIDRPRLLVRLQRIVRGEAVPLDDVEESRPHSEKTHDHEDHEDHAPQRHHEDHGDGVRVLTVHRVE